MLQCGDGLLYLGGGPVRGVLRAFQGVDDMPLVGGRHEALAQLGALHFGGIGGVAGGPA
jgi:hypothetical protein